MQKTVLVADDDPDVTQALAMRLKQLGLHVVRSPDATHALVGVQRLRPDLVILDVNMPGGNGLAVAEMLASDAQFRSVPVIIHTGRDDELTRIRCTDPNHYYVLKSPGSWEEIKSIVCKTLGIPADPPRADDTLAGSGKTAITVAIPGQAADVAAKRTKVLCIDHDPDVSKSLKSLLAVYDVEVLRTFNGVHGYWTAIRERPDAIICDLRMPDGDGSYIVSRLESHPLTQNVPIIILTAQPNTSLQGTIPNKSVKAYLSKPLVFSELLRELRAHVALSEPPVRDRRTIPASVAAETNGAAETVAL